MQRSGSLSCGMWDLVSRPGVEPWHPALGAQSLSRWSTREVQEEGYLEIKVWCAVCPCSWGAVASGPSQGRCVYVYTVRAIFSFILVCACIHVYFIYLIMAFNPGLVPALCIFVTPFPNSESASSHYVWYIFAYYLISLCVTRLLTLPPTCWSPVPAASS